MDAILAVEKDLDAALAKLTGVGDHIDRVLGETVTHIQNLKAELLQAPEEMPLTTIQIDVIKDTMKRCKETLQCLAAEHRDAHACVSRVGKTIDRSFVVELAGVVPRDAAFSSPQQRPLLDKAIAQHLYRQGLNTVADTLVKEADIEEENSQGEPFAGLHLVVEALAAHDPGPALAWAEDHAEALQNSQLPFKLHRIFTLNSAKRTLGTVIDSWSIEGDRSISEDLWGIKAKERRRRLLYPIDPLKCRRKAAIILYGPGVDNVSRPLLAEFKMKKLSFLLTARREGLLGAVMYAQENFPQFVSKHEKEIQRTMCLLAYEGNTLPTSYSCMKDDALWADAIDVFLKDACAVLNLPPLSPLESAFNVGSRVLPSLLDIRMKMANTHVQQVWSTKDELPVEVEGGGHHSVFACPILRQQCSEQNPPMRLLCGHVISKDALNKLCQGLRLKCPYCPMEQAQSESKLIYF